MKKTFKNFVTLILAVCIVGSNVSVFASETGTVQSPDSFMVELLEKASLAGCSNGSPCIYRVGNDYISYVRLPKTDKGISLYIASYNDERLLNCVKTSEYTEDDTFIYLKTSLPCDDNVEKVKAFLWDGELSPVTMCSELSVNYLLTESFETTKEKPSDWGAFDWGTSTHMQSGYGTVADSTHGERAIYLNDIESSYCGFIKNVDIPTDKLSYNFTFDVKVDSGASSEPTVRLLLYKTDENGSRKFVKMVRAVLENYDSTTSDWQTVSAHISDADMWSWDFDSFTVMLGIARNSNKTFTSSENKIYFDDLKVTANECLYGIPVIKVRNNSFGSWYNTDDEIKYIFESGRLDMFSNIKATVYDIEENVVFENTLSASNVATNGFAFSISEPGYYEVEFSGIYGNNSGVKLSDGFVGYVEGHHKPYIISRFSFAVVSGDTKPMANRNDALLLSDGCLNVENLQLANLVGFSGVRIHTVDWGTTASEFSKGFHIGVGEYDWTKPDLKISNAENVGFKTIIPNVVYTPQWAVAEDIDNTGNNIVGAKPKNLYAPSDMQNLTDAMTMFATRYKDRIDGIEFWNEPYYGENKTAFWYDTADKYREMTVEASKAIKSVDATLPVIASGHFGSTNGCNFLSDMLKYDDYKNSFDILSYHGRYDINDYYRSVMTWYGMDDVPVMNSEGYYYSLADSNTHIRDFDVNNLMMLMCYFKDFKDGLKYSSHFYICDSSLTEQNEVIEDTASKWAYGLFRKYPLYMPYAGAVILHTLFENVGLDFEYDAEYDVSGIKMVSFDTDSTKLVALWNPSGEDFSLDSSVRNLISTNSLFIDYVGKTIDPSSQLSGKKLYYIKNADATNLSQITQSPGTAINKSFEAPYYTCVGNVVEDVITGTYAAKEGTIADPVYDTSVFTWSGNDSQTAVDSAPGMDVSYEETGLHFYFNVNDSTKKMSATSANKIKDNDCIKISFDTYENGFANERNEFHVGMVNNVPTLYKYHSADTYSVLLDNYHESGTTLDSDYVSITETATGMIYDVFIPYSELYPYRHVESTERIRASVAVVDVYPYYTIFKKERGAWCFGEGLYNVESNPARYAQIQKPLTITLDVMAYEEDGNIIITGDVAEYNGTLNIDVTKSGSSIYSGETQIVDGRYICNVPITEEGTYEISVTGNKVEGNTTVLVLFEKECEAILLSVQQVNEIINISCTNENNEEDNISIIVTCADGIKHMDQADKLSSGGVYNSNFEAESGVTYYIKAMNKNSEITLKKIIAE